MLATVIGLVLGYTFGRYINLARRSEVSPTYIGQVIRSVPSGKIISFCSPGGILLYPMVIYHSHGKSLINGGFNGKSSMNGPFSMAMLNNQRVITQIQFSHVQMKTSHRQIVAKKQMWNPTRSYQDPTKRFVPVNLCPIRGLGNS